MAVREPSQSGPILPRAPRGGDEGARARSASPDALGICGAGAGEDGQGMAERGGGVGEQALGRGRGCGDDNLRTPLDLTVKRKRNF